MRLTKEQKDHLEVLKKYGILIDFNEEPHYHGRARHIGDKREWKVDPTYNSSGYPNMYNIPALSVGEKSIAEGYAYERAKGPFRHSPTEEPEIYRISSFGEATVLNFEFDKSKLNKSQLEEVESAIKATFAGVNATKFSPVPFNERDRARKVLERIEFYSHNRKIERPSLIKNYHSFELPECIVDRLKKDVKCSSKVVEELCHAHNNREYLPFFYIGMSENFMDDVESYSIDCYCCKQNNQALAKWYSDNHIIGVSREIFSGITGDDYFTATQIFDLTKIDTEKRVNEKLEFLQNLFSPIAVVTQNLCDNQSTLDILQNETTEQTMNYFAKKFDIKKYLDLDSGVCAGYTIGEHTETVLRNFDNNFSEKVPLELLPLIRTAIISHDIGKGVACLHGEKYNQKFYNSIYAEKLYCDMNIPEKFQQVLQFVIGDSQIYTTDYFVGENKGAKKELYHQAKKTLENALGQSASDDMVRGLVGVCEILQTCDSGAYTTMAVTRGESGDTKGIYYKNVDYFNDSFKEPVNLMKNDLTMKTPSGGGSLVDMEQ